MRTQMLGALDIDDSRLADDLERNTGLNYGEQYIEFNCGHPWKSCMLWSGGGTVGDGVLKHYDTGKPCLPTANGEQLPYLRQIVEELFVVEHLLFGRLVVLSNNVLIPHRDYLELAEKPAAQRASHRLHIPLTTSEDCLFMDGNTIYRMRVGEVWSLDVTAIHSGAVLSDMKRVHLILDFADVPDKKSLLRFDPDDSLGIPESNRIERPPMSGRERDAVLGLSGVIDLDNLWDIFGIVIKKQYRSDGGDNYAWKTMEDISMQSENPEIQTWIKQFHKHCLLERYE